MKKIFVFVILGFLLVGSVLLYNNLKEYNLNSEETICDSEILERGYEGEHICYDKNHFEKTRKLVRINN